MVVLLLLALLCVVLFVGECVLVCLWHRVCCFWSVCCVSVRAGCCGRVRLCNRCVYCVLWFVVLFGCVCVVVGACVLLCCVLVRCDGSVYVCLRAFVCVVCVFVALVSFARVAV